MNPTPSQPERPEPPEESLVLRAIDAVRIEGKASVSFIQRRFRLGYVRATHVIDELTNRGIIGPRDPNSGTRPIVVIDATATRTPAPEAVAGEPDATMWFKSELPVPVTLSIEPGNIIVGAPTPPDEADKDAEIARLRIERDDALRQAEGAWNAHGNMFHKLATETGDFRRELTTARATIAERDAEIARMKHHESALEIQCLNQLDQLAERDQRIETLVGALANAKHDPNCAVMRISHEAMLKIVADGNGHKVCDCFKSALARAAEVKEQA